MKSVSVRDLRNSGGEALYRVEQRETVVITRDCNDGMRQLSAASGSDYARLHGGVNVYEAERNRRRKFYCSSAIYA